MSTAKTSLDDLRIDRENAPRRSPVLALTFIAVIVMAGIAVAAVYRINATRPAAVRTAVVTESVSGGGGSGQTLLNASGYVTARRAATVSSKITGKVMEVLVEEGMKVEQGQVLSRIDSSNVERGLDLAKAQVRSAREALDETRANIALAERDLQRARELAAAEVVTQSQLDQAIANNDALKARLERQQAEVNVAEREVELWEQQLDDTIIRAPFSGVVTEKNAQPGEMISTMSAGGGYTRTGICTIVDMTSLEIEVDVSESYINRVQPDQKVLATLDSYPDWEIPAKVIAIIPTADRQKATVKVRVGFDELDPRILPDMSVRVAFMGAEQKDSESPAQRNVTIPKSALIKKDGRDIVWVVRDGKVERRAVNVGAEKGDVITIAAGLTAGEVIVLDAPAALADGDSVTEVKQ